MRSHRPRVLFLINSLGPYGAETFVLNHATRTDRRRFEPHVCQMGGPEALAPQIAAAGIPVHNLREARRLDPRALARLVWLIRRLDVQVLQTHLGYAGIVGRLIGRAARVKAIVSTEQTVRDDEDYPPRTRRAMDLTFRMAHVNVFISRAVRDSFAARFPDRAGPQAPIITNGIDGRAIAALAGTRAAMRAELGIRDGELAFVTVARLQPRKGHRFAIEALAGVRARAIDASLWLMGEGPERASLTALAERLGVADVVHFLGQRLDVHRLLPAFDACVHPALIEGLGIAVLEAMAAGLPAIATRVGGIPEFVRDGATGLLADPGSPGALAEHMVNLAHDAETRRRLAASGQQLVLAEHDLGASVAAYEEIYARLLSGRRAAVAR